MPHGHHQEQPGEVESSDSSSGATNSYSSGYTADTGYSSSEAYSAISYQDYGTDSDEVVSTVSFLYKAIGK